MEISSISEKTDLYELLGTDKDIQKPLQDIDIDMRMLVTALNTARNVKDEFKTVANLGLKVSVQTGVPAYTLECSDDGNGDKAKAVHELCRTSTALYGEGNKLLKVTDTKLLLGTIESFTSSRMEFNERAMQFHVNYMVQVMGLLDINPKFNLKAVNALSDAERDQYQVFLTLIKKADLLGVGLRLGLDEQLIENNVLIAQAIATFFTGISVSNADPQKAVRQVYPVKADEKQIVANALIDRMKFLSKSLTGLDVSMHQKKKTGIFSEMVQLFQQQQSGYKSESSDCSLTPQENWTAKSRRRETPDQPFAKSTTGSQAWKLHQIGSGPEANLEFLHNFSGTTISAACMKTPNKHIRDNGKMYTDAIVKVGAYDHHKVTALAAEVEAGKVSIDNFFRFFL